MRLTDCPRQDPRSIGAKVRNRQGPPVKSCSRQRRPTGSSQQPAPHWERVPDEVFGVRHVHDAYAVAAVEQHHAPREPEGPWPTSSPARALCWLAAAEQQVVFDERRDHRLPARSAHHWPAGVRWWRLPPPNATSEWTGDECAHCLCTKKSVPRMLSQHPPALRARRLTLAMGMAS